MPDAAICSQFVISATKTAESKRFYGDKALDLKADKKIDDRMNIRSSSTPMALESYFYKDKKNYDLLVYTGTNAYATLGKAIKDEMDRIEREDPYGWTASNKRRAVMMEYEALKSKHEQKDCKQDSLQKCLELLSVVMPVLNQPRNWYGVFNTTSYKAVRNAARGLGIFERDIERYTKDHSVELKQFHETKREKKGR